MYLHFSSLHATVPSPAQSVCHSTITCPECMPQYHNLPCQHATVPSPAQSACHSTITYPVCTPQYHHLPSVYATVPSLGQCLPQYHHLPHWHATVPSPAQCVCHRTITCPLTLSCNWSNCWFSSGFFPLCLLPNIPCSGCAFLTSWI